MSFLLTNTQGKALAVEADGMFSPYQKVEYLESTGTQYINTGILPSETMPFLCEFQNSNTTSATPGYGNVFGGRYSSQSSEYQLSLYGGGMVGVGSRNTNLGFQTAERHIVSFDGGTTVVVDGVEHTISKAAISKPRAIVLFGINQNSGGAQQLQAGKIYRCSFGDVFDAIPVRVGNVGYMYDRVSGQLFGNAGTGDFVLGPDIPGNALAVKYDPGYVTDGLIFWLDGIDKGASDGSWVDKIGGHVFAHGSSSPTSIDTGFYFDGTNVFYNKTFLEVTAPETHTIEIALSDAQVSSDGYCLFTAYAESYSVKRFYVAFVGSKSKICLSAAKTNPMYNYTSAEDIKSIVSCPDGRCYINNVPSVSDENNYYSCTGTANRIGCGYYNSKGRHYYKGNIHAIRIYNRSLTAEEIAHNYALDMMRFNL